MEMGLLGGMQEDKSREVVGMKWSTVANGSCRGDG